MPGTNGFRVLKKLCQDPLTTDILIVMISGNQAGIGSSTCSVVVPTTS